MLSHELFCSIYILKDELEKLQYPGCKFESQDRQEILQRIETIAMAIIRDLAKNQAPSFVLPSKDSRISTQIITTSREASLPRFSCLLYLLSKLHYLTLTRKISTKRELFYEKRGRFKSQTEIDRNINALCRLLNLRCWQLNIRATSKGLVAGSVTFIFQNGERISADGAEGILIPSNLTELQEIVTSAKWVLIIEKDSCFQNMIQDGGLSSLGPCLFVTGKGYPDVNTLILIKTFWTHLKIPILVLVDADPYGIEIMCCYRFGSSNMMSHSPELATPAVRWIGVHPSDISRLNIPSQNLAADDYSKLRQLLKCPNLKSDAKLEKEVKVLLNGGVKAEIEGIRTFAATYLVDVYLPSKIANGNFM